MRDGAADGAADAGRPLRQLQRRAAAGAVDEHHHLAGGGRAEERGARGIGWWD